MLAGIDQFCGTSKMMNDLYNRWWYDYIDNNGIDAEGKNMWTERRKLDRENTIPATIELLKNSGFREAECIYNFMKFGAIVSIK
jgi:tRNA (cmo5U34)-methyltransferase